jgi:hypothetical protein
MMILNGNQTEYLKSKARYALAKLEEQKGQKEEWRVDIILRELYDVCGMGYSMAMGEVCSTPWEFKSVSAKTTRDSQMDALASEGWELYMSALPEWLIWRRRKAVAEIAAKEKERS